MRYFLKEIKFNNLLNEMMKLFENEKGIFQRKYIEILFRNENIKL